MALLEVESSGSDHLAFQSGLRNLWESGRLCDVHLESRDGIRLNAHRVVLSAMSKPLAALLGGDFVEGKGEVVQLDCTASTLRYALQYVYGGSVAVQAEQAPELLQFAHLYALQGLEAALGQSVLDHLSPDIALRFLVKCDLLGLDELESRCERYAAENFEQCVKVPSFESLPAAWLGRLLRHEDLVITHEEAVLQAVLAWRRAAPERDESAGLLLQHVRFPMMALPTLQVVQERAQSMGNFGTHLQREARVGIRKHQAGVIPPDCTTKRRRYLSHWWPDLGALPGGVVVAGGNGRGEGPHQLNEPSSVVIDRGAVVVADKRNGRVVRWMPGATRGQPCVGRGAPMNGIKDIGVSLSIAASPDGTLFVADRNNNRILRVRDGDGEIVGDGQWTLKRPLHVRATETAVYVLDDCGTRVQKLENGTASLVAGGKGSGAASDQLDAKRIFVAASGAVYIADSGNARVQRWMPGATQGSTVAGGHGHGDLLRQLSGPCGLFVTVDETIYIADKHNHRIVKWLPGAAAGVVAAGGNGPGTGAHQLCDPVDVVLDSDGALYVVELSGDRVTRWGPPAGPQGFAVI